MSSPRSSTSRRPRRPANLGPTARRAPALAAALLAASLVPPAAAAPTPAEVGQRARALLADGRFQVAVPPGEVAPEEPAATPPRRTGLPGGSWRARVPGRSPAVGALAWLVAGLALVLLVAALALVVVRAGLRLRGRPGRAGPAEEPPAPEETGGEGSLAGDVDTRRLAAAGSYGRALHALLLAAIAELARRAGAPPPPSRTSRELLAHFRLEGEAREAFGGLVAAVERSLFGGAPVGPEDYRLNLARFAAVAGGAP
jgi:Domain of unknown function (DUF4129)